MKKYKTILIDPPWDVNFKSCSSANTKREQYKTMSIDEIKALPLRDLADDDCNIFLWTTHTHIRYCWDLMDAWGFKYNGIITWDKGNGLVHFGLWRRTEFCLHGFKSQKDVKANGQAMDGLLEDMPELFSEKRTKHSRKPISFVRMIEAKTKEPRLEMFARANRRGWDAYGNEVANSILLPQPNGLELICGGR